MTTGYPQPQADTHLTPVHGTGDSAPQDVLFGVVRRVLFELDPERAHDLALRALDWPGMSRLLARYRRDDAPFRCMDLDFPNRVGLAAGLDKNGDHIDALGAIGFGHLEIGTVTPRAQPGNPRPRIFRLENRHALVNRLGFNNLGVDHLVERATARRYGGILGINIGKNATTPNERAADDYLACLERVWSVADYVTINISSPNTTGLRDLQHGDSLARLLDALVDARERLSTEHGARRPIAVKIAPDMSDAELDDFCAAVTSRRIDGVITGNTTRRRDVIEGHLYARETGGLSGAPLRPIADERLAAVRARLGAGTALIGVGGIGCGADAAAKRRIGADLVQLYTGFIFHGPALVRDCVAATATDRTGARPGQSTQ